MAESTKRSKKHDMGETQTSHSLSKSCEACMHSAKWTEEGMVVVCKGVLHYESECDRGAGCGKTARPDLHGGLGAIRVPTITV